ncbi:amidohydrolase 2 [Xylona heveae TC161]|uniref:6-methylsalicylate decarboxylase n=1 Tax=Xylona heveae (strain CBS 132557 / TC161) TaxID=1328760 RepID=A0A165IST2_XYLHT|nr:amidohydrolase 2 [Xylona heveae TC161]KZF25334.1 amidohydrolase 2 [Xylona heveae TC161]
MVSPGKVDVHHHFIPPAYEEALFVSGGDPSGWKIPKWSLRNSQVLNSRLDTTTTILSITAPGAEILPDRDASRRLARELNEYAASIRDAKPREFGFFATLPSLRDQEGAMAEIHYALTILKADGICLYTSYGPRAHEEDIFRPPILTKPDPEESKHYYLGHASFRPIWELLSSFQAVVFIHPTHPRDTTLVNPLLPQPMMDYPHESARSAADMILTGTKRGPASGCKIILSHAGGTLPTLIERVGIMLPIVFPDARIPVASAAGAVNAEHAEYSQKVSREQVEEDAKSFYFDLALSGTSNILDSFLKWAPHDRILFGSDYPYAPAESIGRMTQSYEKYGMSDELRRKIDRANAERVFRRFE